MKSDKAKVAHRISGKALVNWVLDAASEAGSTQNIVVVGHKADEVITLLPPNTPSVMQTDQKGTGHAVKTAVDVTALLASTTLVLCGDAPLIKGETLKNAFSWHIEQKNMITVLTTVLEDSSGYGRIVYDTEGNIEKIVEQKDATPEIKKIREINTGIFFFDTNTLKNTLPLLQNNNSQREYYLTDALGIIIQSGGKAGSFQVPDSSETLGINDRVQLAEADAVLQKRIKNSLMKEGASFILPDTTWVSWDTVIGEDTVIMPGSVIDTGTIIGRNCTIGPNTRIAKSTIHNGAAIANSVITESIVGEYSNIGPFAYLRPGCIIGKHVKIGDFVEIKKSVIGDDTKISHLTYVGDAEIGERVNLGCGVVVVNYDGRNKNKTIIGDDAFIGCNTNLVSPVEIKEHAYIAAGSTITKEVPPFALGIARSRQTVLEDWVKRKGLDKPKEISEPDEKKK